jgi:hypothetical protein
MIRRPPEHRQWLSVEAKYFPAQGRSGSWGEDIIGQATFEQYEENLDRSGSILLGHQVPMIQMKRGGHPVVLLMDTGMTHSVVTQQVGPLSQRHVTIVGALGDQICCPSPYPENTILIGKDMLCKLRAEIILTLAALQT